MLADGVQGVSAVDSAEVGDLLPAADDDPILEAAFLALAVSSSLYRPNLHEREVLSG
jgi:hypothetical protein